MSDCGSAVGAERCGGLNRAVARGAERDSRGWFGVGNRVGEDLVGDICGLCGVVLADAARHEETLNEAEDGGDASPEEDEIQDAGGVSAQVKVMSAEVSQDEGEKKSDDLIFVGAFVLCVEPAALLIGHAGGVERVDDLHDFVPLVTAREIRCVGRDGSTLV